MPEASADQLKEAVEGLHDCRAALRSIEAVHETFKGKTVWDGSVHVFEITGHPQATVCYAWSSPIEGTDKRKFYAVLAIPPVASAVDAIRVTILSEDQPE